MLRELINFTKSISKESYEFRLIPSEGIHIQIELSENGNYLNQNFEFFKEGKEITPFLSDCLRKQVNSDYISMNKVLDARKKIHSCSPFCIAFKIKTFDEIQDRLDDYFDTALSYCVDEKHIKWTNLFHSYCKTELIDNINQIKNQIEASEKQRDKRFKFSDNHHISIYLVNTSEDDYRMVHHRYLTSKVFNKEEFSVDVDGIIFGVSDYLSGYNEKKPYLQHQTATFTINTRYSNDDALTLYNFSKLQANRLLPNPLPIFIDKQELNDEVVKIFNREGEKKIPFSEIIKEVYTRKKDLGNYFLLNFWGISVRDFDFVSSFQYQIEPAIYIKNIFNIPNMIPKGIDNIFDFEKIIVQKIFDNQLIQSSKDGKYRLRYFDDIDYQPQYISATMYQLVLKYRKAFYDYIFKSKRQSITSSMFHHILKSGILENIKEDKYKEGKHTKNYQIKDKLNIWFSLYEFFDNQNNNGEQKMANKIVAVNQRLNEIATVDDKHIENDDEFAFAAGQVIYYLLSCSEAGNKTHALLEPFLQKSDLNEFKMAISRIFNQYKHAIRFYKGKFEKLMTEVLSYELDSHLKHLMPMILAGYFADSIIYQKTKV